MKKLLLLISLIYVLQVNAQDKEYTIKAWGSSLRVAKNGDLYFIKKEKKKHTLIKLNKNFEQELSFVLPKNKSKKGNIRDLFFSNSLNLTDDSKYLFWGNWLIDKNGKIKEYYFGKEESRNINPVFDFLSNKNYTYIGPLKGRKNLKKQYEGGDIHLLSRKNKDLSEVENTLEEAILDSNFKKEQIVEWSLGENFDDYFNMLTRDIINENRNIDSYHVVSYDYTGKIKNYKKLTVKLKKRHFILSRIDGPAFARDFSFGLPLAPNNLYTDKTTGEYYIYGFFTDKLVRNMNAGIFSGFYIHKFNDKGEVLWTKDFLFDSILFDKKHLAIQTDIHLNKISDNEIIIRASHERGRKGFLLYRINSKKGELIKMKDIDFKNPKFPIESGIESGWSSLKNKKLFPNLRFSYDGITAVYLYPEIYQFASKINDIEGKFEATILEDGSVIVDYTKSGGKRFSDYRKGILKIFKFNKSN